MLTAVQKPSFESAERSLKDFASPAAVKPKVCVLVADDHEDTRQMFKQWLETLGCRVIEAADGAEAVSKVETCRPDVCLMDVRMPIVDGLEAARQIRRLSVGGAVPILFVSASSGVKYERAAIAAGGSDYLVKPFVLERLKNTLEDYLNPKVLQNEVLLGGIL